MNHGNANGWTPLMYATAGKKPENVKLLLDCGAEVEKKNIRGKTFRAHLKKLVSKKKEPLDLSHSHGSGTAFY